MISFFSKHKWWLVAILLTSIVVVLDLQLLYGDEWYLQIIAPHPHLPEEMITQ